MPLLLIHGEFLNVVKGRNQLAQQTASCAIRSIAANLPCSDHLSACKPGPSVTGEVQTKIKRVTNLISLHPVSMCSQLARGGHPASAESTKHVCIHEYIFLFSISDVIRWRYHVSMTGLTVVGP